MKHVYNLPVSFSASLMAFAVALLGGMAPPTALAQTGTISGQVTESETNTTLPGVNVVVVGTDQGTTTDAEGRFEISGVQAGSYDLRASFIGYRTKAKSVSVSAGETTTVNFSLQPEVEELEEVVVVGYGTQERADVTGAVTSVDAQEVEAMPTTSIDNAIKGRAAGVYVKQADAAPGGGTTVRIRGTNSIRAGSEPLYVVDGFPIYPDNSALSTGAGRPPINALATLNLKNVESIEILKDASSTAIYGSRGASGVVLVETAGGQSGETQIRYSGSQGYQMISNSIDMLSASQYAEYRNLLARNNPSGGTQPYTGNANPTPSEIRQQIGGGTNWMENITRTGSISDHALTVSGGSENNTYAVTGNFHRNEGILLDTDFQRLGVRLKLQNSVLDGLVNVDNSWSFSRVVGHRAQYSQASPGGLMIAALGLNPIPSVRQQNGEYNYPSYAGRLNINPVAELKEGIDENRMSRFFGNSQVTLNLTDGLDLQTRFGADVASNNRDRFSPDETYDGRNDDNPMVRAERSIVNLLSETTVSYQQELGDVHSVDAVAGYSWQNETNRLFSTENRVFPTDVYGSLNLQNGSAPQIPTSGRTEWNLQSFFGRLNYIYDSRYLATFTFRRDGSSKFGKANKWANFPSAALAWRVNNESFFENSGLGEVVSNLKIRASWGLTGNSEVPVYQPKAGLKNVGYVFGGNFTSGVVENRLPNPNLRWEETTMRNVGLDLGFLDQKYTLTVEYFQNTTDDLLLNTRITPSLGFPDLFQNAGSMENSGFEVSASATPIENETVRWNVGGNVSVVDNEITSLGDTEPFYADNGCVGCLHLGTDGNYVTPGAAVGVWHGFEYVGTWDSKDQIESNRDRDFTPGEEGAARPIMPGWPRFRDLNDDGVINSEDRKVIGNPQPDFRWGVNTTLNFWQFDMRVFVRGVHGKDVRNLHQSEIGDGIQVINQVEEVLTDSWKPENPNAPREDWTPQNENASRPIISGGRPFSQLRNSSFFIEDGTYIRLQNVTLGYTLPSSLTSAASIEKARVYVGGDNLFTITDYSGFDPEVSNTGQSNINRGNDYGAYPRSRTITTGINLTF